MNSIARDRSNQPAKRVAECSPGWGEAKPADHASSYFKACFSGRYLYGTVLLCLLALWFEGCTHSVNPGKPAPIASPALISSSGQVVKISTAPVSISVNGSAAANVTLSISPGFHINANPATFPYLIATEVQPGKADGITTDRPVYPAPIKKKFEFAEQPLDVYEREAQISLVLRLAEATKGQHSVPIKVRVQACDNEKCYPPATLDDSIVVNVN